MNGLDKELVRETLAIPDLLERFGYEGTHSAGEYRYNDCPWCGAGSSGKFCAQEQTSFCHSCGRAGDLFAVWIAIMGLSPHGHFQRALIACADLAGISPGDDVDREELARKREQRRHRHRVEAEEKARQRAIAERGAAELWHSLAERNTKGQEYVASRGILPQRAARECRYTSRSVCQALIRDGQIVNIVGRRTDGFSSPKIRGLDGCGIRGTFGKPNDSLRREGPVYVVEGFFDSLTARQMFPENLVLGAHGCSQLAYVATVAAEVVRGTDRRLVFVPHNDEAGRKAAREAITAAIETGAVKDHISIFALGHGCNDLNDHLVGVGQEQAS